MIQSITFEKPFWGRRYVEVSLSSGSVYRIRRAGKYVTVTPPCHGGEREALGLVYKAAWEWLNGARIEAEGYTLDGGAKIACGRLVGLLDWPADFTQDTESRLRYVVAKFTHAENIFS